MKKIFLTALALFLGSAMAVHAETFVVGGITYSTLSDNTVAVDANGSQYTGTVIVPATVANAGVTYTVTALANACFYQCKSLTKVVLPETITTIGGSAFYECTRMQSVNIPDKVTTIGASAFMWCYGLTVIDLPAAIESIGASAFTSCTGLKEINVAEGGKYYASASGILLNAEKTAVIQCPAGKRTAPVLPNTIEEFGDGAFANCSYIPNFDFPTSLRVIGPNCFYSCSKLTKITLPASLEQIGSRAFASCSNITSFDVAPGNTHFVAEGGVVYDVAKTELFLAPKTIASINFPSTLKTIGTEVLSGTTKLTEIKLPEGFTTLGRSALQNTGVVELVLPESCTDLGQNALSYNSKMVKCVLPSTLKKIPQYLLAGCTALQELTIPASVTSIERNAFSSNTTLPKLIIQPVNPPSVVASAFDEGLYSVCLAVVPANSYATYKSHPVWGKFTNMVTDYTGATDDYSATIKGMTNKGKLPYANPVKLTFRVYNAGRLAIKSLSGILTIDGDAYPEQTFEDLDIASGATMNVTVELPLNVAKYQMSLNLTKINGRANKNENAIYDFALEITDNQIQENAPEAALANFKSFSYYGSNQGVAHYDIAMYFDDPKLAGMKITGASFTNMRPQGMGNYEMWISETLPTAASPADNIVEAQQEGTDVKSAFAEGYVIGQKGVYVGLSFDVLQSLGTATTYPVPVSGIDFPSGHTAMWNKDNSGWDEITTKGCIPVVLYIDGDIKADAMAAVGLNGLPVVLKGNTIDIPIAVANYGSTAITSLDYTCQGAGLSLSGKMNVELGKYISQKQQIILPVEAVATAGNYDMTLTINKVNGNANSLTNKDFTFTLAVGDFQTTHRPVMEEFTGTSCGYCPRGTLALAEMHKRYPDFIAAAYHLYNTGDPMYLKDPLPVGLDGAPSAMLDRDGKQIDPYYGTSGYGNTQLGVENDYKSACSILAPADMAVEATWNQDQTQINVNATAKFSFVEPEMGYKMGYILTIDSLSNPTFPAWQQTNYQATDVYTGNDDLIAQIYKDGKFDYNTYSHVVIETSNYKGIGGSLPTQMNAGESYSDARTLSLQTADHGWADPDNLEDADLSRVNVIALLLDKSGRIRNAAITRIAPYSGATSVTDILGQESTPVYYDLMGRRMNRPANGIFIKVQNGQASKVAL